MLNNATDFKSPILNGKVAIGTVAINNDPLFMNRIKVRIPYLHPDNMPDEDLPWIVKFTGVANINAQGSVYSPDIGTKVAVFFPTDDLYSGIYFGSLPNVKLELLEDYPNTYGFIDRIGTLYLANTVTGYSTFYHFSGTKFSVDGAGHVLVQVNNTAGADAETENPAGIDIQVMGNANITSDNILSLNGRQIEITGTNSIALKTKNFTVDSNIGTLNMKKTELNADSYTIFGSSSGLVQSKGTMKVIGAGGSYDATGASKIDGHAIGMYADTGTGASQQQFFAFAVPGSADKANGNAPKEVKLQPIELNLAAPRENQSSEREQQ